MRTVLYIPDAGFVWWWVRPIMFVRTYCLVRRFAIKTHTTRRYALRFAWRQTFKRAGA